MIASPSRPVRLRRALVLQADLSDEYERLALALGGPMPITDTVPPVSVIVAKKATGHWMVFGPDARGCAEVTASLRAAGIPIDASRRESAE